MKLRLIINVISNNLVYEKKVFKNNKKIYSLSSSKNRKAAINVSIHEL